MAPNRYLIVNADDYGYGLERDEGIIECFKRGAITNVSLMVNGVNVEKAVELAKQNNLSLGLHLNLTEGNTIGKGPYRTLVKDDGFMLGMGGFRDALKAGTINISEVETEIQAQIDKFSSLVGHPPLSVDGHQHCHVKPEIAPSFCSILEKNNIKLSRLPVEPEVANFDFPSPWGTGDTNELRRTSMLAMVDDAVKASAVFTKYGIRAPFFTGLRTMGRDMTLEHLQTCIREAYQRAPDSEQVCELMCHPGYQTGEVGGCGDGPDGFSQSDDRVYEMNVILDERMRQFYNSMNITLISFPESYDRLG